MGLDEVSYSKLPADLQAKLAGWEKNNPANKQVEALVDLSDHLEHLIISLEEGKDASADHVKELGAVLLDIRQSMAALEKKETPESPDYAGPVVGAVKQLETALTAALRAVEVKPEFKPTINVDAPQVNVAPPDVDLKGVERVLQTLPKAFQDAISAIPESPETDLRPVVAQLQAMSEQLSSIDTASRMKPLPPSNMKVTNPDGSFIGAGVVLAKRVDTTTTANTIYVGAAPVNSSNADPVWQMKKITTTNGADVTWADGDGNYNNVWDNRASLSYG